MPGAASAAPPPHHGRKRRSRPDLALECAIRSRGHTCIAGVDEAGRGPLAGPVMVGVVVLPPHVDLSCDWLRLVNDSKVLSSLQRERAFEAIQKNALACAVGSASALEIDESGLTLAVERALLRAIHALGVSPDFLLCDFMRLPSIRIPFEAVVDGDALSCSVGAASIAAKVTRDRFMQEMDRLYPGYGFARHVGYATPEHLAALERLGPCPEHRRSFAPVREALGGRLL